MSDDLKRFRATVRHEGENIFDPPWLEEFWAVRHEDAADRIEELEAKLAKAVEALEFYATKDVTYHNVGTVTFHGHDDNGRKARAALAEINGGGDT